MVQRPLSNSLTLLNVLSAKLLRVDPSKYTSIQCHAPDGSRASAPTARQNSADSPQELSFLTHSSLCHSLDGLMIQRAEGGRARYCAQHHSTHPNRRADPAAAAAAAPSAGQEDEDQHGMSVRKRGRRPQRHQAIFRPYTYLSLCLCCYRVRGCMTG
jgi:hypothetical protein